MNADGLYLAIYAALRFNLKLINIGYYISKNEMLPLTEVSNDRAIIFHLRAIYSNLFLTGVIHVEIIFI